MIADHRSRFWSQRSLQPKRGLAATGVLVAMLAGCQTDKIHIHNATLPNPWGVLVDGTRSTGVVNDQRYRSSTTTAKIGHIAAGMTSNEQVVAFTRHRPVVITPAPWTESSTDVAHVAFPNKILIPVTVWIVKGPFAVQRALALDHCVTTVAIWNAERMGVSFSTFQIIDATGDPDAPNYHAFTCQKRVGIQNDIGFKPDRINVYWVDTVDGATGRGHACAFGSNFIAMGRHANDELLVHEFAHNFDLRHTNDQSTFDTTNIMHSASSIRQFITEGQLFRMHLSGNSALNTTYAARPGQPVINCTHDASDHHCPALETRIWADGAWPAN